MLGTSCVTVLTVVINIWTWRNAMVSSHLNVSNLQTGYVYLPLTDGSAVGFVIRTGRY